MDFKEIDQHMWLPELITELTKKGIPRIQYKMLDLLRTDVSLELERVLCKQVAKMTAEEISEFKEKIKRHIYDPDRPIECCEHCPNMTNREFGAFNLVCNCTHGHTTCDPNKESIDEYCLSEGYSCRRNAYECRSNFACAGFCNRI